MAPRLLRQSNPLGSGARVTRPEPAQPLDAWRDPLAEATRAAVVVGGDAQFRSARISGPVVVDGDLELGRFVVDVDDPLLAPDVVVALRVRGKATLADGLVRGGDSLVQGQAVMRSVRHEGELRRATAGDGDPLPFGTLRSRSRLYAAVSPEVRSDGTVTVLADGDVELVGTDPITNIFSIDADTLSAARVVRVRVPAPATGLVNVAGRNVNRLPDVELWNGGAFGPCGENARGIPASIRQRLLWNFADARDLTIAGRSVHGTVLAPHAAVLVTDSMLHGCLIAGSVVGPSDGVIDHVPFRGTGLPPV